LASWDPDHYPKAERRSIALGLVALLVVLAALILSSTAQAHSYYHNKPGLAAKLDGRITTFRIKHNESFLWPGIANTAATIGLQKANYQEHKWTTKIEGVPYPSWSLEVFPPPQVSAILTSIRPHGLPWTPYQVMKRWKHKPAYRAALLFPGWLRIGVRAGFVHQHKGAYKGKGRCTVYYVSLSGPGL
jgi:hypothetical protein